MSIPRHIVLVGAGLAAQRCCQALRRRGHDGPITLVGDEGLLPYDRPPLSKEQLAGGVDLPALELRPRAWYDDQDVGLVLDDPAVGLDPAARLLRLASGSALRYDRVLVATGARPVLVPGAGEWQNAYTLRSAADAAALGERLRPGARLAIVGAGFIGQEAAATARSLGVDVTMIEAAPAPLHGILGPELGGWFAELHHQEGVRVLLGARIERFHGRGETLEAIVLADGAEVDCDALLIGAGVRPAAGWLDGSGLPADGVPVDGRGATVAPAVYAAGDVCRPIDRATGMPGRSDHWEAAVAQGVAAAHGMLGLPIPAAPRPSFWSDQYGIRIQFAGDARGADAVELDGDPDERDFAAFFIRAGIVRAGLLVGRPRALPALRAQLDQPLSDRRTA